MIDCHDFCFTGKVSFPRRVLCFRNKASWNWSSPSTQTLASKLLHLIKQEILNTWSFQFLVSRLISIWIHQKALVWSLLFLLRNKMSCLAFSVSREFDWVRFICLLFPLGLIFTTLLGPHTRSGVNSSLNKPMWKKSINLLNNIQEETYTNHGM